MNHKQKKTPGCLTIIGGLFLLSAVNSILNPYAGRSGREYISSENSTSSVSREIPAAVPVTEAETHIETEVVTEQETIPETEPETIPETEPETIPEPEPVPPDFINPDFKAAMDSYKAFFEEYAEFMRVYSTSENMMELMGEYMNFMVRYTDTMEKLDAIDEETLFTAEDMPIIWKQCCILITCFWKVLFS